MALTATLALDIKAFEGGLSRATASLEGFAQKTVKNTNRDLSRMLEEFTGQKVVAESARMAEAVERIGGASKLTEAEQRRVNATVSEAIEKYRVLGEKAPESLVKLHAATAQAESGTSVFTGTVGRLAAAFSVASLIDRGVSAVLSFGRAALTSAGELVDLHNATGASIESLQRWTHVAEQGGIELTDMTTAAFKLGTRLDGGSGSVKAAVDSLGLSFTTLKSLKPEDQMDTIMRAADAMGSSQERNTALVDLFGARGAQALARVVEGYTETAEAASVSSEEQVRALDRASDAWARLTRNVTTSTVTALGTVAGWVEDSLAAIQVMTQGLSSFSEAQQTVIADIINDGGAGLADYLRTVSGARKTDIDLTNSGVAANQSYAAQLGRVRAELAALTPAQRVELDAAKALGVSVDDLVIKFGLSEEAVRQYGQAARAAASSHGVLADSHGRVAAAVGAVQGPSADLLLLESRSIMETGKLTKALELWAKTNSATLAPSIRQVNAALDEQSPLMVMANSNWVGFAGTVTQDSRAASASAGSFFDRLKAGMSAAGTSATSLSGLFQQAFLGGGGATGALKAFATQGVEALMGMIPGIPPWLKQFAGPIVEGLSKLAAKGKAILASMFGGPSSSEKAGRASVAAFEQSLHGALTATQELEAGGEDWKKTVIAIRDAYIAAGRTEQEALAAAEKLWKSSTISAEESLRVIEEIKAIMHALPTNKTIEIDVKYNTDGTTVNPDGSPTNATQPVGPFIPAAPGSSAMGQMGASQAPVVVVVTTIRRDDIDPVEIGNMAAAAVAQHYPRNGFDLKTIITDSLREA